MATPHASSPLRLINGICKKRKFLFLSFGQPSDHLQILQFLLPSLREVTPSWSMGVWLPSFGFQDLFRVHVLFLKPFRRILRALPRPTRISLRFVISRLRLLHPRFLLINAPPCGASLRSPSTDPASSFPSLLRREQRDTIADRAPLFFSIPVASHHVLTPAFGIRFLVLPPSLFFRIPIPPL